ncbi:transposase-like zinc-binding domain-containing protein [Microcoleus sp. OTE_8_concoct_300]
MKCPECSSTHIRKNGIQRAQHSSYLCRLRSAIS